MATTCFFCSSTHNISERTYDIPLCHGCQTMERFQILLLQQLCFIQSSLYEMREALRTPTEQKSLEESQ